MEKRKWGWVLLRRVGGFISGKELQHSDEVDPDVESLRLDTQLSAQLPITDRLFLSLILIFFFSSPSSSLCFQLSLFCKISQVILQHTHAHCGSYLFCVFSVILTGMHHFNNRGLFIFSLPRFFPFVLGQQLPWRCLFWCPTDDYHHKHLGRSAHASCLLSVVNSCRCGMDA